MELLWIVFGAIAALEAFMLFAILKEGNPRAQQLERELNKLTADLELQIQRKQDAKSALAKAIIQNMRLVSIIRSLQTGLAEFDDIERVCESVDKSVNRS